MHKSGRGEQMTEYCKIVIVDDEFLMRQGLKHMVDWESKGFQVVGEAANGKEALAVIEQQKPHIILSDMVMPLINGVDFTFIVKEKYPDIQIIILSGYDDFEYVKNAMKNGASDYILKPTVNPEELLNVLQKTAKKIPGIVLKNDSCVQYEKSFERYLSGYENESVMHRFDAVFPESFYIICGVQIKNYNEKGQDISGTLYEKIQDWFAGCSKSGGLLLYLEEKTVCLVINFPKKNEDILCLEIKKLSEQIHLLCAHLLFIKSVTLRSIAEVKSFYHAVMVSSLEKNFYFKNHPFLELENEAVASVILPKFNYNDFTSLLNQRRYQDAMALFFHYIQAAVSAQMEEDRLKNQAKNVLYNLLDALDGDTEQLEAMRKDYFKRIDAIFYAEDFLYALEIIESELEKYIIEHKDNEDIVIDKILDYISEHYNEELELAELAQVFNFNYSYLSTYFSKRIPEGFSGYLNKVRIKQACILLKRNDMSIAQISNEAGYSDQSYFCRVFKKITGKSPSDWKKQQMDMLYNTNIYKTRNRR